MFCYLLGYGSWVWAHWDRPGYYERIKACLLRIYVLWVILFVSWVYGGRNEFTVRLSWFLASALMAFWAWWVVEAFQSYKAPLMGPNESLVVQLFFAIFFECYQIQL